MATKGFVYVYRCIVGTADNFSKIGITTHFRDKYDRMTQSLRTPYFGFIPFVNFETGDVIATGFKVKDVKASDRILKEHFQYCQLGNIEVYNITYHDAVKGLFELLSSNDQLISFVGDGITDYSFLTHSTDTSKSNFENIRNLLLSKYDELPQALLHLLRDKEDAVIHCPSHLACGNYIEFPNNMILDLHCEKAKRFDILSQLSDLL